jgi:ubiquinone/menaquinone biosynthesis C-methylase UbiE
VTTEAAEAARAAAQKVAIATAFDNSADTYEQVGVAYFGPMGTELVRRAAPEPGADALDLGCGRGHVLFPLAAAVGPTGRVTGVDLSARMVELCAARSGSSSATRRHRRSRRTAST